MVSYYSACTFYNPELTFLKQVSHKYQDRNILLDVWEVISFKGNVIAREGQEVRWITIDDMGMYRFPEADIPVIQAIANNAKVKTAHLP